ncbi:MAG TPA: DUF1801 domain-containing protein [Anaerolineales bacterium]|nr:DUF1801 domain-containing protein [Anaerolineales bacterium]
MKKANSVTGTEQVNAFLDTLDHPFKAEVEMIREIIKNVNEDIAEQIKWNAPSFSYKGEYLVTFNLRAKERIHLVFHNPMIARVTSPLLEGDYPDRRMAYFSSRDDIQSNRKLLEKALADLIKLQN